MQAQLSHPDLPTLELGCDPYVLVSLQIGSPAVRAVTKELALGDGVQDDTRFMGARAITAVVRAKSRSMCSGEPMQRLIDRLTPYMNPAIRPTLSWQLPGGTSIRSAVVRGESWPYLVAAPKHPLITLQWAVPSGEILAGGDGARRTVPISPASDTEDGREYDREYDRTYPPSAPIGGRTVTNPGNAPTHWDLTIYGPVTDPLFTINGRTITFDRDGGVSLAAGQTLVINTRTRTALFNGNVADSRYSNMNYEMWDWDDLRLRPGENQIRFAGDDIDPQTSAVFGFTPRYL